MSEKFTTYPDGTIWHPGMTPEKWAALCEEYRQKYGVYYEDWMGTKVANNHGVMEFK